MDVKFPAVRTGYAEPKETKPKVAIFDEFREDSVPIPHGEMVESVMLTHGELQPDEIQRYHAESGAFIPPQEVFEAPQDKVLEAYFYFAKGAASSFFNMVSDNLETVMQEQPSIKVVNQSQSQTPARILQPFLGAIADDPSLRGRLAQRLGLDEDAGFAEVTTNMLKLTELAFTQDKDILHAKERYTEVSRRTFDSGILNIVAAGNQGTLAASLQQQGVETSEKSFRSALVNDWVTVVGSASSESKISSLTSPNSGAEVYALGEDVPFMLNGQVAKASGTSLSAPLVANFAVQLLEEEPGLSPGELESKMKPS